MTIDEAIDMMERAKVKPMMPQSPRMSNALQLGIEALKRLKDNRRDPEFDHWILLPGETEG